MVWKTNFDKVDYEEGNKFSSAVFRQDNLYKLNDFRYSYNLSTWQSIVEALKLTDALVSRQLSCQLS